MKNIECFKCEECNEIYEKKDEALSCEKSHVDMGKLKIIQAKHVFDESRYGYPEIILVEITDYSGCYAEYSKIREGSVEEFRPYFRAIDTLDY